MPEHPLPRKSRPQPLAPRSATPSPIAYAELHARSNFSLLRGASHPDELVARAGELGYRALALTDEATLAGAVRAHTAAEAAGIHLVIGSELALADFPGTRLLLHVRDRSGYANLSRLLTLGRRRVDRVGGQPASAYSLRLEDVLAHAGGLLGTVVPGARDRDLEEAARLLGPARDAWGELASLALELHRGPDDTRRVEAVEALSLRSGVPLVAANDVHFHVPERARLAAVLACIREGTTLERAGTLLFPNGERHLRPLEAVARVYEAIPEALARTVELAAAATFRLDELRYEYPEELVPPGETPASYLRRLTEAGARGRYPAGVDEGVRREIERELALIAELGYEPFFLTVYDIVKFARERGILCQGRGSAANSAVCFCLGITSVDPARIEVLFERFVSRARKEPPDIDVDFEHERREEVLQYVYEKYGRDRAGIAAEVITYRGRSAVRDVGKALGFSLDQVDRLAKNLDWTSGELESTRGAEGPSAPSVPWHPRDDGSERLREAGLDPDARTTRLLLELSHEIEGFPRHLSQHVGGMVIARGLLSELVPIQNASMPGRTFIEWDKDDLDDLGMLKVDCLALGMLTCIRKTMELVQGNGGESLSLATIPAEDPAVYDMLCRADAVGVFQVESRAQMNMLPRLAPRRFYDLVVEVSIVRPGPIQGGIVHPYLRRRQGVEPVAKICPSADRVLEKTLGVPVFQEQAMRLAIEVAGFTPDEADALRKAMGAWRKVGTIEKFRERFVTGVVNQGGTTLEAAEELFDRIHGFGEYGFPESHAASFALLVYASAWLKRFHPAAFAAGLLNAQPMGFYQPAQIVRDAREHGVPVLPPCVQRSGWDTRLEGARAARAPRDAPPERWGESGPALRLGLRQIKGLRESAARALEAAQKDGPFASLDDLARRAGLSREPLERLAVASALASFGIDRREALFQALGRAGPEPPLFRGAEAQKQNQRAAASAVENQRAAASAVENQRAAASAVEKVNLPRLTPIESVARDYATLGLTLDRHPVGLVRRELEALGARPTAALRDARDGERLATAGIVICRQRPQTASGIVFFTLEDETGVANLIVRPDTFERFRSAARGARLLLARGKVEREGPVIHLLVTRLEDVGRVFAGEMLAARSRDFH
jgi:error-prone DNA polymerase